MGALPSSLTKLTFAGYYEQLNLGVLPPNLIELHFCPCHFKYSQDLQEDGVIPESVAHRRLLCCDRFWIPSCFAEVLGAPSSGMIYFERHPFYCLTVI